ncbi:MAG: 50S ribosomal protein L6 [Candidatus Babeliales bacterium]
MSKIGRKPIDIGSVQVDIKGQEVHYKGKKHTGVYILPPELEAKVDGKKLTLAAKKSAIDASAVNTVWGLHRALLANAIKGADVGFEQQLQINGLGFKAAVSGNKVVFSLGFSHKIDFVLPKDVTMDVDKTGQNLTVKSYNRELVGHVCSKIKALRPPEPYKGTGIKLASEVIRRKAGKTKAA